MTYSLYQILDSYGFKTPEQKSALQSLMHQSSILNEKKTLQERFPSRHAYDNFVKDIFEFVKLTQEHFMKRTGTQERWEVIPSAWMEDNKEETLKLLTSLGLIDQVMPENRTPDAICILGATYQRMSARLSFAQKLLDDGLIKTSNLILLAGERYVTVDVDGSLDDLTAIASHQSVPEISKLTETHLIKEVYQQSKLYGTILTHVIDTPRRDLPRPTTQTTILELIEWLKTHPDIKYITFVSNQPYVKYQAAVIQEVMRHSKAPLHFEVVGSDEKIARDNLQPSIEALGSYIWAKTPEVLISLGKNITDPSLQNGFRELYGKQPLVYQNLEYLFNDPARDSSKGMAR